MSIYLCLFLSFLISLLSFDALWLKAMTATFYRPQLSHLFAPSFDYAVAALFYLMYAAGTVYILMPPALALRASPWSVFCRGWVLGLVAYGAYNLTNQATLLNWPSKVTVVDMLWGASVTGVSAWLAYQITRRVYP